jgi:TolB-like protein/DNA-binding winged helix-turn-helix (wHTH) protein
LAPHSPQNVTPPFGSVVRFGHGFELRTRTRELYRNGIRLKLRPQPFHVLQILVENTGDVVTREEFQKRLWPSDTFVDFEHGLNSSVKNLRAVLGDSVQEPRYIETVPKIGYRFIAVVERRASEDSGAHPVLPETALVGTEPEPAAGSANPGTISAASRRRMVVFALSALAILMAAAYLWRLSRRSVASPPAHLMLAVLPFQNLSGDANQEFVADGLTDEIISRLGQADPGKVGVIARTSVMRYKHSGEQVQAIGQKLGAQYVLKGTLRRDADTVRITADLIGSATALRCGRTSTSVGPTA